MNLIVDGGSLIHRVHWIGQKHEFITSYGENVSDIYMFLNTIRSYVQLFNCSSVYVAWDKKILWPSTNFRKENFKEYKGQRDKEQSKEVYLHEDEIIRILGLLGIKNMLPRIMEADDVISWLSRKLQGPNIIVSSDGDLLQLVSETTSFYQPFKKILIDIKNFEEHIKVPLKAFLFYKAIKGDISDNITGIKGYGEVKSKELAKKITLNPSSIQNFLNNDELEKFNKNIKLMDLAQGYKLAGPEEIQEYENQFNKVLDINPQMNEFKQICEKYEFQRFLNKFEEWERLFGRQNSKLIDILNHI